MRFQFKIARGSVGNERQSLVDGYKLKKERQVVEVGDIELKVHD